MTQQIQFFAGGRAYQIKLVEPTECPACFRSIAPRKHGDHYARAVNETATGFVGQIDVVFSCPSPTCSRLFIASYESVETISGSQANNPNFKLAQLFPEFFQATRFDEAVCELSPQFELLYNESAHAEQMGLSQICGPGYRKGLEFLVKDYAIAQRSELAEDIKAAALGKVIQQYLSSVPRVQDIAKRAVWLGNDETHYVRKWADKDIHDLKDLIKLTVHWIAADLTSQRLVNEMPNPTS